jgi:hypothetical protein
MSLRLKSVVLLDGLVLGYNELLYICVALVNVDKLEDGDKELCDEMFMIELEFDNIVAFG